jgi:hypothetical protein
LSGMNEVNTLAKKRKIRMKFAESEPIASKDQTEMVA